MQSKLIFFTTIVLLFFASNSLLVKYALLYNYADAYSLTFLRLLSGALVLVALVYIKEKKIGISFKQNRLSSLMLFAYAIFLSYSYLNLDAGLGALILFAAVQLTILLYSLIKKEDVNLQKILGIIISFLGLVYLLYPSESFTLSLYHVVLMIISGIAWGAYTLLGKNTSNATRHTMDNFVKATLLCLISFIVLMPEINITSNGILLAFISGGITSALGYALWYYILPQMQSITSGVVQLLAPPITIFISVLLLGELLTFKLIISTCIILIGIFLAIYTKKK